MRWEGASAVERGFGAYGLRLSGIEPRLLVRARADWPQVELVRCLGRADYDVDIVTDSRAQLALESGGGIIIERSPFRATFTLPSPVEDAELVHPYLGTAAAMISYWCGREVFHAGAFVTSRGAWVVLGEREAGKSSLLAWLALNGHGVVSDDIVVVDEEIAYAGPRSVDLRQAAAKALGAGSALGVVGARERWRLELKTVEEAPRLAGWIFLGWGDDVTLTPVRGSELLKRLAAQRAVRLPPRDATVLLRLAGLPAWELQRPPDWTLLGLAAEAVLARIA